jgi:integrase
MKPIRTRYQAGSLTIERRKSGPSVWIYRWREEEAPGKFTRRKQIVGTKEDFPNKAAAQRAVEGLRMEINVEVSTISVLTVDELIEHYRHIELSEENSKTIQTKKMYLHHLLKIVSPHWGGYRLRDVKPFLVEAWFKKMQAAPGTKAKTKGVMNVLFQHAMRYEWATSNPYGW